MVRAKFKVRSITLSEGRRSSNGEKCDLKTVQLLPVCGDSPENRKFFESTPSGSIDLGTINPDAAAQFEVGKEYYVDFTPVAQVSAGSAPLRER